MPYKEKEVAKAKARARYAGSQEVRDKQQAATKRWLRAKPRHIVSDSLRGWALTYRYKMTIEQYEALLVEQGGHCALCSAVQGDSKRRMTVDHDHACCDTQKGCGKCNRGILCANCNRKIGFLEATMAEATVISRADTWTDRALTYLHSYGAKAQITPEVMEKRNAARRFSDIGNSILTSGPMPQFADYEAIKEDCRKGNFEGREVFPYPNKLCTPTIIEDKNELKTYADIDRGNYPGRLSTPTVSNKQPATREAFAKFIKGLTAAWDKEKYSGDDSECQ